MTQPRSIQTLVLLLVAATPVIQFVQEGNAQFKVTKQGNVVQADGDDEQSVRTHGLYSTKTPDRSAAVSAFAAQPKGKAAIEKLIQGKNIGVSDIAKGTHRHDGKKHGVEAISGANWNAGFLVDGMNPDLYTKKGKVALRLRTNSVVVHPSYSIQDMVDTGVMRLKGSRFEQLFRVTVRAPEAKTGDADPFLISIGMLSDWKSQSLPPVAIFMDGKPLEYTVSKQGLQLVKRMRPGNHRLTVHVTPEFEGDLFEFRYVLVNRL